jgi:pimeloyl-ACP methyl ester carboxylesterase
VRRAIVELTHSPLAPGVSPVRIAYRDYGRGAPLVFLHGGWGYEIYPFDHQIAALGERFRIVIPDRSGYGQSTAIDHLEPDFHAAGAEETLAVVDALALERPVLWGHSDGAVIAALAALARPGAIGALILEAMHLSGHKPSSRGFFAATARDPDSIGDRAAAVLAHDHGEGWRALVARHSAAWLRLGADAAPAHDFYDGRLGDLRIPTLVVHGARDPRTEPGELEAIYRALVGAECAVFEDGAHSPHTERATAERVTRAVVRFLS